MSDAKLDPKSPLEAAWDALPQKAKMRALMRSLAELAWRYGPEVAARAKARLVEQGLLELEGKS